MKKIISVIVALTTLFMLTVSFVSCEAGGGNIWEDNRVRLGVDKDAYKSIKDANETFSAKMFGELLKGSSENGVLKENVSFSPLSISFALAMTYNGTKANTRQELGEALGFDSLSTEEINAGFLSLMSVLTDEAGGIRLDIGNALFGNKDVTFKSNFTQTVRDYYNGHYESLDFSNSGSKDTINKWVRDTTNGKIKEIVSQIDPDNVLFILNAIYFDAEWKEPFDKEDTDDDTFTLLNGEEIPVKMMKTSGDYHYKANETYRAVKMPYGTKGNVNMCIFVPRDDVNFDEFLSLFNEESFKDTISDFKNTSLAYLHIPRFGFYYTRDLEELMKNIGVKDIFTNDADLSDMTDRPDIQVSRILHKTYIRVNERGTEAAAVTNVLIDAGDDGDEEPIYVRADRPFVFMIRDDITESILFMGVVIEP